MADEIFVDTSGFYALLAKRDDRHKEAAEFLSRARRDRKKFVTTDYVLDETATLLLCRKLGHLLPDFFNSILESNSCSVAWTDAELFHQAKDYFIKHRDEGYSFTDCVTFQVMMAQRIRTALTKDIHFERAGFVTCLK